MPPWRRRSAVSIDMSPSGRTSCLPVSSKERVPSTPAAAFWSRASVAGFAFQRELELYVKAGIPANEVLRIATWNGATYARVLFDRGSVERGKRADLILIDGDPTQNISAVRNVALV